MKSIKTICSVVLLMATVSSYAQDEVIIIDRKNYRHKKDKQIRLNDNTQVVKFAPLNLLSGEINFGYERQISQKGSLDFEIGPTLSNIGFGLSNHIVDPWVNTPTTISKGALGFVFAASYRYYPLDETEALNRFYVAPVIKFKVTNTIYEDGANLLEGQQKGGTNMTNFYFNFGYQTWLSKTFSMDFYAGFGIGMQNTTSFQATQVYDGNTNTWKNDWVENSRSGAVYVGNIGVKVGIGSK